MISDVRDLDDAELDARIGQLKQSLRLAGLSIPGAALAATIKVELAEMEAEKASRRLVSSYFA